MFQAAEGLGLLAPFALEAEFHAGVVSDQRRQEFTGLPYREAKVFEKAYLIHLLQDMIEAGVSMSHVDTPGEYIEIDTQQDFEYANNSWN